MENSFWPSIIQIRFYVRNVIFLNFKSQLYYVIYMALRRLDLDLLYN